MKIKLISISIASIFLFQGCSPQILNVADVENVKQFPLYPTYKNIELSLNRSDKSDFRERTCWNSGWGSRGAETNYESVDEKSSEKFTFFADKPTRHFEGIKSAYVIKDKLHIYFLGRGEVEEYEAPIFRAVNKVNYVARPGSTLFMTMLGLGIPMLVNPSGTVKRAFGCTDENVTKKYANVSLKEKTGRVQWANMHKDQRVIIEGVGDKFQVFVSPSPVNGEVVIDLKEVIARGSIEDVSKIQITCSTCVVEFSKDQSIAILAKTAFNLESDFRPIKAAITEKLRLERELEQRRLKAEQDELERRKLEKARLDRELEDRRRKAEQEELERRKQKEKSDQIYKL